MVDGGKKRRVGGSFDPEKEEDGGIPFMVKIGGVRWEEGIGGVEAALHEAGVEFCEGTRWLVKEEELEKRRKRGSLASTVVVRVKGEKVVHQLGRAGVWVGGYWCSVKRFVAVQPKRKVRGWERVWDRLSGDVGELKERLVDKVVVKEDRERDRWVKKMEEGEGTVLASLRLLGDRMERLEGMVKGVGKEMWRRKEKKEVVEEEEEVVGKMEEESEEEEVEMVKGKLSVFAKPFVFEPKGKKVDFGKGPPSPRGDTIFSWE